VNGQAARVALIALLMVAGTAVQGAWFSRLPPGITPDLLLLLVLAVAIRRGPEAGAYWGAAAGYLRDLVDGGPLGLFSLTYLAVGAAVGAASSAVDPRQRHVPAALAFLATFLLVAASGAVVAAAGTATVRWHALAGESWMVAAVNALLAGPTFAIVGRAERLTARRYAGRTLVQRVPR
jgi:rod shape-determining protein MreD